MEKVSPITNHSIETFARRTRPNGLIVNIILEHCSFNVSLFEPRHGANRKAKYRTAEKRPCSGS